MKDDLVRAAFEGHLIRVTRLLDGGADIDADGQFWNPLHAAIENENLTCVQLLIRRGADVERLANGSVSPLSHAVDIAVDGTCQRGQQAGEEPTEIIELLLQAGADPASALACARRSSPKITELLARAMNERATPQPPSSRKARPPTRVR